MRRIACIVLLAFAAGCAAPDREPDFSGSPIAATPLESSSDALGEAGTDVDQLRSFALAQNPDVLAANRATLVAMARARQAGLFPNPVLTYAFTDLAINGGPHASPGEGKHVIGVSQALPISGRIAAARREAEGDAELAKLRVALARRELVVKIDEELAAYIGAREKAKLAAEQLARMKSFEEQQSLRVRGGEGLESDLTYTRVELEKTRLEAEETKRRADTAEKILEATVGRDLDVTRLKVDLPSAAPPLDEAKLTERAKSTSPTVVLLDRQARTARATLERAREERVPDITVALFGGYASDPHSPVIEGGIAIPLPLFNRNQYQVEAALRDVERAERSVAGERIAVVIDCAEAAREYESSRLRVEAFRAKVIPAAQENLKRSLEAFAAGKIPDRDVLVAQRSLIENEIELVDARLALARAIARIERLTGSAVPTK